MGQYYTSFLYARSFFFFLLYVPHVLLRLKPVHRRASLFSPYGNLGATATPKLP